MKFHGYTSTYKIFEKKNSIRIVSENSYVLTGMVTYRVVLKSESDTVRIACILHL